MRRAITLAVLISGSALAILAVLVALYSAGHSVPSYLSWGLAGISAVAGGFAVWHVYGLVDHHFTALERLRGAILTLAGDRNARLPVPRAEQADPELRQLHDALGGLVARQKEERTAPDARLQAVLASIAEAMVVITDDGQVSLVNHAAKALLGAERVAVGTSVYAALTRTSVLAGLARAREAGKPVDAMIGTLEGFQLTAKVAGLGEHGGAVLTFPPGEVTFRAELDHDLALHDRPPPARPVAEDSPLDTLPVLVLDTETTGLAVKRDRIVAIGAVRLCGGRVYRSTSFDRLVNPGVPIPPRSTAVHGITDGMVAEVGDFPAVFERLRPLIDDTVMVGHHITFDLAMLARECALAGLDWTAPPYLDTLLLTAALEPALPELSLDALAEWLGVDIHGRHTALGDSLVTAEVYSCLLHRLRDRGVTTFGEATDFSKRAKHIIRAQEKAGW